MKRNEIDDKTKFNLTFNNIYAIIFALILVAASWFNLSTRVDLLTQRVDILIDNQKEILNKYSSVEARYGDVALKVAGIEALLKGR